MQSAKEPANNSHSQLIYMYVSKLSVSIDMCLLNFKSSRPLLHFYVCIWTAYTTQLRWEGKFWHFKKLSWKTLLNIISQKVIILLIIKLITHLFFFVCPYFIGHLTRRLLVAFHTVSTKNFSKESWSCNRIRKK